MTLYVDRTRSSQRVHIGHIGHIGHIHALPTLLMLPPPGYGDGVTVTVQRRRPAAELGRVSIWKPQKVKNCGLYLVYTRYMTISVVILDSWYIPGIYLKYDSYYYYYDITSRKPGTYLLYTIS